MKLNPLKRDENGVDNVRKKNINLNVTNAKLVLLEDIVWISTKAYIDLQEGEYLWYQYRYKEFGPKILELMEQEYSEYLIGEDQCNLKNVKNWQVPEWYLTERGIVFKPISMERAQVCSDQEFIISYEKLKPYWVNKYHFMSSVK